MSTITITQTKEGLHIDYKGSEDLEIKSNLKITSSSKKEVKITKL